LGGQDRGNRTLYNAQRTSGQRKEGRNNVTKPDLSWRNIKSTLGNDRRGQQLYGGKNTSVGLSNSGWVQLTEEIAGVEARGATLGSSKFRGGGPSSSKKHRGRLGKWLEKEDRTIMTVSKKLRSAVAAEWGLPRQ